MTRPRLVLDTSSLVYRAYFALPATIRDPEGRAVNAVRGYLDMTSQLLRDRAPSGTVHVFDADWRPAWRVAAYAGYKSTRRDDPPELPRQFDVIVEVLDAAGMPRAEAAGYEADDVIGTIATTATEEAPVEVVSGDRDMLQVVRDGVVTLLMPVRGVTQLHRYDEAEVMALYGVPPRLYAEMAMLRGDPSDGLPGVRGVGPKTAAELLARHGSLEALLSSPAVSPRIGSALRAAAPYLAAMRTVVPVGRDVAHEVTEPHPPDTERMSALAAEHGLGGTMDRLLAALSARPAA